MYNGVINIYKEKGYTSHDVVAKLRGILKQKKIGHTGTLDPMAEGVLPVCIGKATKLCDMLTDHDKTYVTEMILGIATDTQDTSGTVQKSGDESIIQSITEEQIIAAVRSFAGEYAQIPPMYSAIKVDGKKLYEIAREGKEIVREPRSVFIHSIEVNQIDLPRIKMTINCSKGTYIRTLCHDIGLLLNCYGCMDSLVRTRVGRFEDKDAVTLSRIETLRNEGKLQDFIISIEEMFPEYPKCIIQKQYNPLIYNGNQFTHDHILYPTEEMKRQCVKVFDELNQFIGIYKYIAENESYKVVKMFL